MAVSMTAAVSKDAARVDRTAAAAHDQDARPPLGELSQPFRLAWRIPVDGGLLVFSDDLSDAANVKAHARTQAAEAYGAEFRIRHASTTIFTSASEIAVWDPTLTPLPSPCRSIWGGSQVWSADASTMRRDLRLLLEGAVVRGLLSDVDALALRRAAECVMAGNAPR